MAPTAQQYTLVGFTEDLDWKPLQFLKPLPRNRLCSICGLVRKTVAHLSCGHAVCSSCYEQGGTTDGYTCPIDGENCPEEDTDWRDFRDEKLLTREVKCWNERHGCPLIIAASEVHKHFHRECEYHSTACPRCSAVVLCRDMGEHVRASCNTHAAPLATECEEKPRDAVVTEILEGVRRVVQEEASEVKALLERVFGDNGTLNDSLGEVSHSMNCLKESVSQGIAPVGEISRMTHRVLDGISTIHGVLDCEIADVKKQNAEEFSRIQAAILSAKADAGESTKTILDMQKKALAYAERNETRCDFIVPGLESLEAKAVKGVNAVYVHGQVYLRGYNISPGVQLKKDRESVSLSLWLRLNKGDHDEVIEWPFEHKIRFAILHPVENHEDVVLLKADRDREYFKKPTSSSNQSAIFTKSFILGDLKTKGYVHDEKLRVLVELI